jgi:hypothetical protein
VITDPASIAWLFNLRGGDVMCTPLPLAAAVLEKDGRATLFIEDEKLTDETRGHLGNEVALRPETEFGEGLKALSGKTVRVDPASSSVWVFNTLSSAGADDPAQARSGRPAQGLQERRGDRRLESGPYPRRRRAGALPALARHRGPVRRSR